jgi:hypothetical protein
MKSLFVAALLVLSTQGAFASQTVSCEVSVTVDSAEPTVQKIELVKSDSPHGAISVFNLTEFGGITGLVSLQRNDYMVISLADTKGYASSSHGTIAGGMIAHHQLILPSPGTGMNVIVVDCQYID